MNKVKVIVERGKDGKYSAFMDCYDFDFGLAGFGNSAKEAIEDFNACYEEEKIMCKKDGKTVPSLEFIIQYDLQSFSDSYAGIFSKSRLEKINN